MSHFTIETVVGIAACVAVAACSPAAGDSSTPASHTSSGGSGLNVKPPASMTGAGGIASAGVGPSVDTSGSGGTGGGTSAGGDIATGGSASVPLVCSMPQGAQSPLPLVVTSHFAPSGYFGGPETSIKGIVEGTCANRPAAHTVGKCFKYTFQASALDATTEGAYGGVFWQYGANNWGNAPGMRVAPGATKVTFKAWSASAEGGEKVQFNAGGIGSPDKPCADGVNLGTAGGTLATLTTTPTEYSVDLLGQTYDSGIIGGFVWSAAVTSVDQVVSFYIDEIQWVQ